MNRVEKERKMLDDQVGRAFSHLDEWKRNNKSYLGTDFVNRYIRLTGVTIQGEFECVLLKRHDSGKFIFEPKHILKDDIRLFTEIGVGEFVRVLGEARDFVKLCDCDENEVCNLCP